MTKKPSAYDRHQAEHSAELQAIRDAAARAQLPETLTKAQRASFNAVRDAAGRYRVAQILALTEGKEV